MYRLYAYADDSDLSEVEATLVTAFQEFLASWDVRGLGFINKKAPLMAGQELPDWNIGLSGVTGELGERQVDELLSFLSNLSARVDRRFVVGTWAEREIGTRDIMFIGAKGAPEHASSKILAEANE